MTRFQVRVQFDRVLNLEVEAESSDDAFERALRENRPRADEREHPAIDVVKQLGEPWVYGRWYDLHYIGDVIVFTRSLGNVFTKKEVDLLVKRLRDVGFEPKNHWNGERCDELSVRCAKRPKSARRAYTRVPDSVCSPIEHEGER